MGFKMKGISPFKHNGSPQEGIPTSKDLKHNTWHANDDHLKDDGDPDQKKLWNKTLKKWTTSYQPMDNPARQKKK